MNPIDSSKWEIAKELAAVAKSHLDADVPAADFMKALERPQDPSRGDYACPCFRFGKAVGKKPPEIAAGLKTGLDSLSEGWVESAEVVGAFLNLRVKPAKLAPALLGSVHSGEYFGKNKDLNANAPRVMVEYSQPNTHKAFHVGHMRNVSLGDSLGRLYEYCGFPVVMANYIGDEGTHIAKCIWYMRKEKQEVPAERKGEWLGEMYAKACIELEDAPDDQKKELNDQVSAVLREIESKEGSDLRILEGKSRVVYL